MISSSPCSPGPVSEEKRCPVLRSARLKSAALKYCSANWNLVSETYSQLMRAKKCMQTFVDIIFKDLKLVEDCPHAFLVTYLIALVNATFKVTKANLTIL